ncbi:hypothetical protein X975_12060, partial [Stegodyphus mimosarum]
MKGDACATFDQCSVTNLFRTCSCDSDCHIYGTCCIDAEQFPLTSMTEQHFHCKSDRITTPVFAKRACAENYKGGTDDKHRCTETEEEDKADIISNWMVTNPKTGVTYWNKQCAVCNNEKEDDLEYWTLQVTCPSKHGEKKFDENYIKKHLSFDLKEDEWGLSVEGDFVSCFIRFFQPGDMAGKLEYCAPNMISTCPHNYTNEDVIGKCSNYYGERKEKNSDIYYKNVHCALCNGKTLKELDCAGRNYRPIGLISGYDIIRVTFGSGRWLNKEGVEKYKCSKTFNYDPFHKRCRRLHGSLSNMEDKTTNAAQTLAVQAFIFISVFFINNIFLYFSLLM